MPGAPEAATTDGQGLKASYPMRGCEDPSGIAALPTRGLILSACANQIARITNAKSGAEVASLPIGNAARVAEVVTTQTGARTGAVDPASGFVYLPTGHTQGTDHRARPATISRSKSMTEAGRPPPR
jgi:hypothetical protein